MPLCIYKDRSATLRHPQKKDHCPTNEFSFLLISVAVKGTSIYSDHLTYYTFLDSRD